MSNTEKAKPVNFIRAIAEQDLAEGRVAKIITRFPPEPNGYLHIGHAKSICVNFGMAEEMGGECNLRFDDTNPSKEEQEYVDAIKEDVQWLGFQWAGDVRYASSYFDTFYEWALHLIKAGKAYVCHLSPEQAKEYRGWATEPGKPSPYRERSVDENLALFEQMRAGEFAEGECVLRANIDMSSPNMNMRDPILYRIRKQSHHQTGDKWCIYPSYDFAHGQEDAIEGVTHSICTLEFADHRPLYEWFIENLPVPSKPRQYEFGRLNINYTVTSKRKLKQLVDEGIVQGWNDPRMPTVAGMRRRGYSPAAIRNFCDSLAVAKTDGVVDMAQLEFFIRDDLNKTAPRGMAVLKPLKVVISNYPEDQVEMLTAPKHPDLDLGERLLPFTREIYIDQDDFKEEYSKKFKKKLTPGKRIRLRNAYVIEADSYDKNEAGEVVQINASLIPDTLGKNPADEINPKGVVHWVSASHGKQATIRLYDRLFTVPTPDKGEEDFLSHVNPNSLTIVEGCWIEPDLANAANEQGFQFEREGYFVADRYDHSPEQPVFNMTIGLRDTWSND
ncbi:glutamine--tRNA ligase/YqeY domain fusion protein [Dasania sp. GY-MA-18]|uniref:Glutamine--tRNA ligase n=1 Tax=Dasania phycosphaerae TaxID=2950436 RepID=A0A9J6RS19_9GAMM|nr:MULTISPECIES: glutamine--tRNA ligase/YqeY domain fusion protein [Dasania]MCR8924314.1 glutamine--tRNA ligase/YqeY domain fusion protein [Dasania sp. GY-MA-18]MCZ0866967.1 glutamine--tRNA ligase/YqeY domain fusion protein [Dasania phycosphaerae]MCZ0870471.1 glutamine--tRNA ligase/YqeY domain fusion protein [Dasania phycosphaerae]